MAAVTLLPRSLRGEAEIVTPGFAIPLGQTAGAGYIRTDMLESDLHGVGLSGYITLEVSGDQGKSWQFSRSMTWESNASIRNGKLVGDPAIGYQNIRELEGHILRARAKFVGVTCGFVLELP